MKKKKNLETTKTEKLCPVQSCNRIQQMAPCFSLAACVRKKVEDCCIDISRAIWFGTYST